MSRANRRIGVDYSLHGDGDRVDNSEDERTPHSPLPGTGFAAGSGILAPNPGLIFSSAVNQHAELQLQASSLVHKPYPIS